MAKKTPSVINSDPGSKPVDPNSVGDLARAVRDFDKARPYRKPTVQDEEGNSWDSGTR